MSNADPTVTYDRLIGRELLPVRLRKRLARLRYGTSALSLFLAIDTDPRALGLDSGNIWYSPSLDVNDLYPAGSDAKIRGLFLTASSLKDPTRARKDGHHMLEAFAFIDYRAFEQWAASSVMDRPEDYKTTKEQIMVEMITMIDEVVPGLSRHIVVAELGTPLSNVHYCQSTRGSLYGTEKSGDQAGPFFAFMPKSSVRGLYLCGASTISGHGVMGATVSGLDVAQHILGISKAEMLTQNGPTLSVRPAEPAP
jgi:phytoene dehydrogenase-like protein